MALDLWRRCEKRVSGWFLSRVLSSLFVGGLTYLSLLILGTSFPFFLGLLGGVSNFIPLAGPFLTGFLIFVLVSAESSFKAVLAVTVFVIIQQIESNILLPILSKKFVGLSPALVLISLAVGGSLGGLWGAVLGLPLMGILFEFLQDFLRKKKEAEAEEEAV